MIYITTTLHNLWFSGLLCYLSSRWFIKLMVFRLMPNNICKEYYKFIHLQMFIIVLSCNEHALMNHLSTGALYSLLSLCCLDSCEITHVRILNSYIFKTFTMVPSCSEHALMNPWSIGVIYNCNSNCRNHNHLDTGRTANSRIKNVPI